LNIEYFEAVLRQAQWADKVDACRVRLESGLSSLSIWD
jgi:hypothetical protein